MQINHMICPNCGHDFYTNFAYATCAACQCFFYAQSSATSNPSWANPTPAPPYNPYKHLAPYEFETTQPNIQFDPGSSCFPFQGCRVHHRFTSDGLTFESFYGYGESF